MANYNTLCFLDYETGSKNSHTCQPMSMACVMIDPVRLEIIRDGDFYSLIRANWDESWCKENNVEVPQEEALNITKLTREDSEKAPSWQEVHNRFESHVKKFYKGTGVWNAPLMCGFNVENYDLNIVNRGCRQFGSHDKVYNTNALFHPIHRIDLMRLMHVTVENKKGWRSISFDTIRSVTGMSMDKGHDALEDCRQGAALLCKWLKWFRTASSKIKLEESMKDVDIFDFYDVRPE